MPSQDGSDGRRIEAPTCSPAGLATDVLEGGPQGDLLFGGPGDDILAGGPAGDECDGGADTDVATADCEVTSNVP